MSGLFCREDFPIVIEFEIMFRNAVNRELIIGYGEAWYHNDMILHDKERESLEKSLNSLTQMNFGK